MGRSIIAIAIVSLSATASFAEEPESAKAPSITAAELHAQRKSGTAPVMIDVREGLQAGAAQ